MPGIGFFAPLPLAMMMPFMAGQSMIMGDAFGKAYQYGKRKISSMTNEEFNKLTAAGLATQLQTDYLSMIPSLKASIVASRDFQTMIIKELAAIIPTMPGAIVEGLQEPLPIGLPPAYGDSGQQSQQEYQSSSSSLTINNLQNQIISLLTSILGGGIGSPVISGPGPNPETPAEKAAADKAAQDYIGEQEKKSPVTETPTESFKISFGQTLTAMPISQLAIMNSTQFHKFASWQQTMIRMEYNKRVHEQPVPKNKNPHQAVQDTYKADVKSFLQLIKDRKHWYSQAVGAPQLKLTLGRLKATQKHLTNYITIARSKPPLKALANRDWNDRIWK